MLRPCRGHRPEPLQLVGRHRPVPGVGERRARVRLAAAGLQAPEGDERGAEADARLLAERQGAAGVRLTGQPLAQPHPEHRAHAEQVLHVAVEVPPARELERPAEVTRHPAVTAAADEGGSREVDERPGGMVVVPVLGRHGEGLLQHRAAALVLLGGDQRRAHVGERVRDRLAIPDPPPERDRALPQRDRLGAALGQHGELRAPAERQRELAAVGELLEHRDRPVAQRLGLLALPRPPVDAREPAQVVSGAAEVALRLVQREQGLARLQRRLGAPAQVRLDRDALQSLRPPGRGGEVAACVVRREGGLPLRQRLPVAARGAGHARRRGGEAPDGGDVPGTARMVGEPRGIGARRLQGLQYLPIEGTTAQRRDRVLDRPAGEIVAEGHRLAVQYEHARVDARVDRARPGAARLAEQPQFGRARHDRDELEHRARVGAQPGDARGHRVAHAAGHLAARRGQRLRDEERIAAGEGAQARAVAARSAGEERDRALGQRRGLDARKALARERGEEAAELRPLGQPVRATGHDEAAARPHQPAREERQQVEGGVVGPVQVLHHEHRGRAGAHLVEERPEHLLARRGALQRRAHRAVDLARHVPQRAHRPRRHERIADAPQHPVAPALRARGGHQRGLADARLARHEDDASGRAGGVQRRVEQRPFVVTLEKLHGSSCVERRRSRRSSAAYRARGRRRRASRRRCAVRAR